MKTLMRNRYYRYCTVNLSERGSVPHELYSSMRWRISVFIVFSKFLASVRNTFRSPCMIYCEVRLLSEDVRAVELRRNRVGLLSNKSTDHLQSECGLLST